MSAKESERHISEAIGSLKDAADQCDAGEMSMAEYRLREAQTEATLAVAEALLSIAERHGAS